MFDGMADQLGGVPADSPRLPFCGRRLWKPPSCGGQGAGSSQMHRIWAGQSEVAGVAEAGREDSALMGLVCEVARGPPQSRGAAGGLAGAPLRARHLARSVCSLHEGGWGDGRG